MYSSVRSPDAELLVVVTLLYRIGYVNWLPRSHVYSSCHRNKKRRDATQNVRLDSFEMRSCRFNLRVADDCTWPLWYFWMDLRMTNWHRPKICRDTNRRPIEFLCFVRSPNRYHTEYRKRWTFHRPVSRERVSKVRHVHSNLCVLVFPVLHQFTLLWLMLMFQPYCMSNVLVSNYRYGDGWNRWMKWIFSGW